MNWILEDRFFETGREDRKFKHIVERSGGSLFMITIVPFSKEVKGSLPPTSEPAICIGTMDIIPVAKPYSPGVWNSPDFDERILQEKLGSMYLNSDAICLPLNRVSSSRRVPDYFFMKPAGEIKAFSGQTMSKRRVDKWAKTRMEMNYFKDDTIDVMISKAKQGFDYEWRLIMLKGKVITGSAYKNSRRFTDSTMDIPDPVIKFAEQAVIPRYNPVDVFSLDVATYRGELYVVEANMFNSAGMYNSSQIDIVNHLTKTYEKSNQSV